MCAPRAPTGNASKAARRAPRTSLLAERPKYRLRALFILTVVDQIVDHGRIGERRGVAEIAEFVLGDLAQDAAHDLAGTGLRQVRRELNKIGRGDRPDLLAHPAAELLAQGVAR